MRTKSLIGLMVLVVGAAFFAVLTIYALPIVLKADEIPRFLLGLGTAGVACSDPDGTHKGLDGGEAHCILMAVGGFGDIVD